jgi:hypothetical protein
MYHKRRYRYVNGRFEKRWDNVDEEGWFKTKAEAIKAVEPPELQWPPAIEPSLIAPPKKRGRPKGSRNRR